MRSLLLFPVGLLVVVLLAYRASAETVEEQCSKDFQQVSTCLTYATGKAATPSKECCDSVTEIKGKHPVCLCYVILQTHKGSEQIKSMGIQESRLIQLPSACKLANASVRDCPKLLNIPVSSPNYAIFTNTNTSTTSTSPSTGTGTSSPTTTDVNRSNCRPQLEPLLAIAMAIFFFFCVFPSEVLSIFLT